MNCGWMVSLCAALNTLVSGLAVAAFRSGAPTTAQTEVFAHLLQRTLDFVDRFKKVEQPDIIASVAQAAHELAQALPRPIGRRTC